MGKPVGAAAEDLVLSAEVPGEPLKDHPGVVVKPPGDTEVRPVLDPLRVEERERLLDSRALRHVTCDLKDLSDGLALRERRKGLGEVGKTPPLERRRESVLVTLIEAGHDHPLVFRGEVGEEMLHWCEVADMEVERDAA